MSEEIRKRIEERTKTISSRFVAIAYEQGAEFGYQLGKDQVKAALRREIEKEIEKWGWGDEYIKDGLRIALNKLDTVEP